MVRVLKDPENLVSNIKFVYISMLPEVSCYQSVYYNTIEKIKVLEHECGTLNYDKNS